ncbi:ABC transporter substrate-binding protein [Pontibacter sp. SGAir0037]|uniref:ABC transporter substrate-binding protein n=1 Tax=Pontibacter sp. SGAir0037 TaxID=2571030 RepID=UPI001F10F61F|nr:ABC transporter substrate-binding protein [Pontibacter sp. SGAir0037]
MHISADPENLNPVSYTNIQAEQLIKLLYQSLLGADLEDNELKPVLAESYPVIERRGSLTYITFTIREEAEWSDGSPVLASDVAFTLKLIKAPLLNNGRLKPQLEFITDFIADPANERKFTFVCEGFSPEMELVAGDFFILPAKVFDPNGLMQQVSIADLVSGKAQLEQNTEFNEFATRFNGSDFARNKELLKGSGGYELDSWSSGQYITLKRKDNWWGKNTGSASTYLTANPSRINFQIIPENTTALLALKNEQLDVLSDIAATEFDQLKQDQNFSQNYNLYSPDAYEFVYAGLNSRLSKFSDKRTRQAIAWLMDVDNFIKVTHQNYATKTIGPVPPSAKEFYHTGIKPYTFDKEHAIDLLKAAGWIKESQGWYQNINGQKQQLTIEIIYRAGNTVFENTALIFQQAASQVGIPVSLMALESSMVSKKIKSHEFDLFFRSLHGNPFVFNFKPLLHTSYAEVGGANYTGFGTPESDYLLDAILATEDTENKSKQLKRLQEIIHDEAAFLPLYYQKDKLAIHKRFGNTKVSGLKPNYDVGAFILK